MLDLACGDGAFLREALQAGAGRVVGVELSEEGVLQCVAAGLAVYQGDITEGLADYRDDSFACVSLIRTVELLDRPEPVLREMLRVGAHGLAHLHQFRPLAAPPAVSADRSRAGHGLPRPGPRRTADQVELSPFPPLLPEVRDRDRAQDPLSRAPLGPGFSESLRARAGGAAGEASRTPPRHGRWGHRPHAPGTLGCTLSPLTIAGKGTKRERAAKGDPRCQAEPDHSFRRLSS